MNIRTDFKSKDEAFYRRQQNVQLITEKNWITILNRINNIRNVQSTNMKFDDNVVKQIIVKYGHIYCENGIIVTYNDIKHMEILDVIQKFVSYYSPEVFNE